MSLRALLRASSDAETAFLDGLAADSAADLAVPARYARPPRDAVLTMRMVRAVNAGGRVSVVEPQDYERVSTLTRRSPVGLHGLHGLHGLQSFYPKGGQRGRNERTGISTGQGPACTGSGCDEWWVSGDSLVAWLKARTRWFRGQP